MQKRHNPNPDDQTGIILRLAKQIAESARENGIGRGELAEWIGLICRMALWLCEVDGKQFHNKLTLEECERRSREYRAAHREPTMLMDSKGGMKDEADQVVSDKAS